MIALPSRFASDTIPPHMIREVVQAEMDRRGWNLLRLAQEAGVSYSRLHGWLSPNGTGKKGPTVDTVERIFQVLEITCLPLHKSKPTRKPRRA